MNLNQELEKSEFVPRRDFGDYIESIRVVDDMIRFKVKDIVITGHYFPMEDDKREWTEELNKYGVDFTIEDEGEGLLDSILSGNSFNPTKEECEALL